MYYEFDRLLLLFQLILTAWVGCLIPIAYLQVPKGLPYFAVEFGLDGGFAHVIENEDLIPHYFGKV